MRKLIVLGGVGAAVAIGVTHWQRPGDVASSTSSSATRVDLPVAAPAVTPPRPLAPLGRSVEKNARHDEHAPAGPATSEIDDGDEHGQAQPQLQVREEPPPSRDAFGADPESETAALAEARATLEALLDDPDPAVKERAAAVLQTIASQ